MNDLERDVLLLKLDKAMWREMKDRDQDETLAVISIRDSQILRLAHHAVNPKLGQYNQTQIAKILNISQQVVSDALERIERTAPQLFPILTLIEAECVDRYLHRGHKVAQIAEDMEMSETAVRKTFNRVKKKDHWWPKTKRERSQRYYSSMDKRIRQKL